MGIFQPGNPQNGQLREKSGSSQLNGYRYFKVEAEQRRQRQAILEGGEKIESKRDRPFRPWENVCTRLVTFPSYSRFADLLAKRRAR